MQGKERPEENQNLQARLDENPAQKQEQLLKALGANQQGILHCLKEMEKGTKYRKKRNFQFLANVNLNAFNETQSKPTHQQYLANLSWIHMTHQLYISIIHFMLDSPKIVLIAKNLLWQLRNGCVRR